jgi:hypothetical protein
VTSSGSTESPPVISMTSRGSSLSSDNALEYNGPQNSDSVISYTWEIKGGGPSGTNAKEVSAFI